MTVGANSPGPIAVDAYSAHSRLEAAADPSCSGAASLTPQPPTLPRAGGSRSTKPRRRPGSGKPKVPRIKNKRLLRAAYLFAAKSMGLGVGRGRAYRTAAKLYDLPPWAVWKYAQQTERAAQ